MAKFENFKARAIKSDMGKSQKKGTHYVSVIFGIVDDKGNPVLNAAGEQITYEWQGWLTEGSAARTFDSLRLCGCTFPGEDATNHAGVDKNIVEVQVEDGEFGKRVAFVNAPRKSSVDDSNRLVGSERKSVAAQFKGMLLASKAPGMRATAAKQATAILDDDPFAVKPSEPVEPANDAGEPMAQTGTDNIPF